jgi:hypothetical protein
MGHLSMMVTNAATAIALLNANKLINSPYNPYIKEIVPM